ncbi:hypothetical protein I307_00547 [Cryptococcus deuterogattii 99/473]|uniref:Unplaced genomic scaffold supercont1.4, whole genome shotgun sequence n=1 Tax=Cryptococcus deuterogattii Ram5 TaxID=1296110 RepID=A0A0D0VAF6_9TREE|nr:hypothetical protein I309_02879 [Cryptococcus deuterogattii LA55]KIR33472.1 hypothetical protein I352_04241 [Cryptococcus deuterogattii MMRL2647]KIR41785.1 hypothetical protein I313_01945 [Cryptococcus deuterogattii Ram5]KIR73391.1 hypothetical protein I310_03057 [Cryptococcus deuterogattii CA1014]KIR91726.1 hypothetical protein I304_04550 [Cryptococcus deuterogattii CBS 10090]KIR99146.1 hypothetical protein L804_03768 [Cryptococcus deuterogattii 2001/935-1]KIY60101.1 hypothetical protein 
MNTGTIFEILSEDPYLEYQPVLAYTLPIQLVVNGITGTLLCVLLIHLLFTTQYHYPLAPLNYFLQLSSIVTVLISVIIKLVIILVHCTSQADVWPYSLDYVAVNVPPETWSTGQNAAWCLLQALNAGLSNNRSSSDHLRTRYDIPVIFPSLLTFLAGPLALVSSALTFAALTNSQTVLDLSDAIRNVFNSTLLLIFTISLAIWGFFVNRRRAWRFDGGTAAFGVGSLFLATISTTFNFVAVAEDGIEWLQHLLFAAILWQIWLGWWWWVGSGMGIGEVEDIMAKAEKKKRKQAKSAARARAAAARDRDASRGLDARKRTNSFAGLADGFTSGVTSILRTSRAGTLTRRQTRRSMVDERLAEEGAMELDDLGEVGRRRHGSRTSPIPHVSPLPGARNSNSANSNNGSANSPDPRVEFSQPEGAEPTSSSSGGGARNLQSTNSETSSTSATPSLHPPETIGQLFSYPTTWLVVYLRRLRKAHQEAAKKAAIERAERRERVFAEGHLARMEAAVAGGDDVGWGLGRFGIREHEESAKRLRRAGEMLDEDRLLGSTSRAGREGEGEKKKRESRQRR